MINISYKTALTPNVSEIIDVYNSSGIARPTHDADRIKRMYAGSNLIVTAWDGDKLVGIARSVTDFCYSCYLSDLAVRLEYQHKGIGKELVRVTKETLGEESMLLLLAAPAALDYYPKIGMEKVPNGYIIKRSK